MLPEQSVTSGVSVVVHCSDGWDRTSQTCALAQLLVDPYYRTIQGFQALIEKDWLHFGHKFSDRCGFLAGDSREISPVFTQFIDATWQLMSQFPQVRRHCADLETIYNVMLLQAFQFNSKYLIAIHDHVYSCQFGTFIGRTTFASFRVYSLRCSLSGNCQRERQELKLSEKTYSLWGHLTNSADEYVNPTYDHSSKVVTLSITSIILHYLLE